MGCCVRGPNYKDNQKYLDVFSGVPLFRETGIKGVLYGSVPPFPTNHRKPVHPGPARRYPLCITSPV